MVVDGRVVGLRDGFPLDGAAVVQLEETKVDLVVRWIVERKDELAGVGFREVEGVVEGQGEGAVEG